MKRTGLVLGMAFANLMVAAASFAAEPVAEVTLTRLDCGRTNTISGGSLAGFTDVSAFEGLKVQLTFSCYLIKHGKDYLVWDTGNAAIAAGATPTPTSPKSSLVEQLAQLKLKPQQITFVAISHYHGDHTGQLDSFPESTLLIGKGDWDVVTDPKPNPMVKTTTFSHWISGGGKVEPVSGDKDIFGDGSVIMLNTPGHTPGHHSLVVKLKETGNVMITGDLAHFQENYDSNGVPVFNTSRADTLASLDRFKKTAANIKATVIIQHDARDITKLPAFPASAK
jgi:N-acyl homoserine lactone hydrolase